MKQVEKKAKFKSKDLGRDLIVRYLLYRGKGMEVWDFDVLGISDDMGGDYGVEELSEPDRQKLIKVGKELADEAR